MKTIFDRALIEKYDQPGPRYTSYPTAPHFHEGFTANDLANELERTNALADAPPLSLYFHIPFCDTLCHFCGCTMIATQNPQHAVPYLEHLYQEIDLWASFTQIGRPVGQWHWGGGTPTFLSPDQIRELGDKIRSRFNVLPDAEISCEIDPRELTRDHLQALREVGFNRLSFGVQDFEPEVQKAINRVQPEAITRQVVDWARELGFESINLDLIYGLPYQTPASFQRTLDKVLRFDVERLAIFSYAHVPWLKKHQALIPAEALPSAADKLTMLELAVGTLTAGGYVFIGMDHFAKPDDELAIALHNKSLHRNFQGYTTRAGYDLYAMGMSAIGLVGDVYGQNDKNLVSYYKAVSSGQFATVKGYHLTDEDKQRRHDITRLMCDFELNIARYPEVKPLLAPMIEDGLVTLTGDHLVVTGQGRLLIRNIAMLFDAHLKEPVGTFSRTV